MTTEELREIEQNAQWVANLKMTSARTYVTHVRALLAEVRGLQERIAALEATDALMPDQNAEDQK